MKTMKKTTLLFCAILLLCLLVSYRPVAKPSETPFHIAPLFTEEQARYYGNWLEGEFNKTADDRNKYNTAFGVNNMGARDFTIKVELYLLANRHLNSLSGKAKRDFYNAYHKWLKDYHRKCQAPLVDENGEELEGSMTIGMHSARKLGLLEEYIATFPERQKLEYDFRKE